jgi:hypothetical protein
VSVKSIHRGLLSALAVSVLVLAAPGLARPPKPIVASFSPKTGSYGTRVTIVGSHLARATVLFNGNQATTVTVNRFGTRAIATVPVPDDEDGVVTGPIAVLTPGGATQTAASFKLVQQNTAPYQFPQPRIVAFTPSLGEPGTKVTVTGAGFGGATSVAFAGVEATTYTVPSDTRISTTVPAKAKTGKIIITTAGGTATSLSSFRIG